jgi:hypothetical protein
MPQEAKYVERWPNTTSAWAGWSRFDIPVDRYGGVHSLLICTSSPLGSPTCHQASQQENTYCTKYQKADRASTLVTLCLCRTPVELPHFQTKAFSLGILSPLFILRCEPSNTFATPIRNRICWDLKLFA